MPSKSNQQRKFFNLVKLYKSGKLGPAEVSDKIKKAAKTMSDKDIDDFASTTGNLPEKVKKECDHQDDYKNHHGKDASIKAKNHNLLGVRNKLNLRKEQINVEKLRELIRKIIKEIIVN